MRAIVVGVGLISGVGRVSGGRPDGSCSGGRSGVAVGTGRYGSPPLSGVATGPGARFSTVPIASTVGFTEFPTAEMMVGEGGAGSSESALLHAEIITANNAAKNSEVFCRPEFINDSMKSLRRTHNGGTAAFVRTASVTFSNGQWAQTYGV